MGDAAAFLKNYMLQKIGIVPEPQYGQSNPTFPVGHPRYGQPMRGVYGETPSLNDMQRTNLEFRRNFMLGRDGFGLHPGFDPYIDELQMQDQYGPARRNAGAGLDAKF